MQSALQHKSKSKNKTVNISDIALYCVTTCDAASHQWQRHWQCLLPDNISKGWQQQQEKRQKKLQLTVHICSAKAATGS